MIAVHWNPTCDKLDLTSQTKAFVIYNSLKFAI